MSMIKEQITNEADALNDIIEWSENRPMWQRDALRRLISGREGLTEVDILELTSLCKNPELSGEPCLLTHTHHCQAAPCITLKSISSVENVNALAKNQTLNFIPQGVTIVYGENGSGKSGLVRILKIACKAKVIRAKNEAILSNIYEKSTALQSAKLEFCVDGKERKIEWKNSETANPLFSGMSVFDSRVASVYVDEIAGLQYIPFPMRVLEQLVRACKEIGQNLETELSVIKGQTPFSISHPNCSEDTQVGRLLQTLDKDTSIEMVTNLATLSNEELSRLAELSFDFIQDPKVAARKFLSQKERLEILQNHLQAIAKAISVENAQKLKELSTDLAIKKNAVQLSSEIFSDNTPLNGLGSNAWYVLWQAAKAYSELEAYPTQSFPVTNDKAVCVLCQQELTQTAAARLLKFKAFIEGRIRQEEVVAQKELEIQKHIIRDKSLSSDYLHSEIKFLADDLGNDEIANAVRRFVIQAKWRMRGMLRENADPGELLPMSICAELQIIINSLNQRAQVFLANSESAESKMLRIELAELKDRQWLTGIKDDLLAEIKRREAIFKIEVAIKATKSHAITQKSTAISEALISERFRNRFQEEIKKLEVIGHRIELQQTYSKEGVSRFQIRLYQNTANYVADILSEGEYRCVALAGFLAELATNDSGSGIVFDDPVSSLDHLHREAIAKRLAEEGRKRQVIIFTHDLVFLFMLEKACQPNESSQRTEIAIRHVQRRQEGPGYCRNTPPEKAQKATAILSGLRTHLKNCSGQYFNDPDSVEWLSTARGLLNSIRQSWETVVADVVSPVLRTFSSRVDTKGFIQLSVIKENDAKTMQKQYSSCSDLLHKIAAEINPSTPTPNQIEKELDAIEEWLKDITDRQKAFK